ncbi:uncharacterized protein LOC124776802 isoform X2 [Schistocerca piceifrons]|uniref:uncharacterized protein LOC124776802 isoform X2 n=1 Tax=Schistocerca piceifrons TaxID=274613 RepID=UPI001F5E8716|nr:uncharacterized protein LOC124776802 isoform X2 [Schistocerca piceifrons]
MSQDLSSRKRGRNNCEEECCDFMPLSKRINNLHINGTIYSTCEQHSEHAIFKQIGNSREAITLSWRIPDITSISLSGFSSLAMSYENKTHGTRMEQWKSGMVCKV